MGLRDWFQKKDQLSQLSDELQELVAERDELSRKCQQLEQQCEKVSASLTLEQYRRQDVLEQVDCLSHLFQRFCTQPPTPEQLYNQAAPYKDLAFRYGLWDAAKIFRVDGCSDDSFSYFRSWLIVQGKDVYMAALADPDSLADVEPYADCFFETAGYVGA